MERQRTVSVIDLGEIGFDEEPDRPLPPAPGWARRLGVPNRSKLAVVGVLAAVAGVLGGTAPPTLPEPTVHVLRGVYAQSSIGVVDDVLLQVAPNLVLTAYDIPTGRQLWTSVIGQAVYALQGHTGTAVLQIGPAPGFEVTAPSLDNIDKAMARGRVSVVDVRTGAERWRHTGALLGPADGPGPLLLLVPSEDRPPGVVGGWYLVGVDRADGHDLWAEPLADHTQWTIRYADPRPERLDDKTILLSERDGTVTVVDVSTGYRRTLGKLPPGSNIEWAWLDLLGVDVPVTGGIVRRFAVYRWADLSSPAWARSVSGLDSTLPLPCGEDVVCVPDGADFAYLDPRTGEPSPRHESYAEFFIPGALGLWSLNGPYFGQDRALAVVSPAASKTEDGWIGMVRFRRPRPLITPLVPIPIPVDACGAYTPTWIVCPGSMGTIVIRQSELAQSYAATPGLPS